MSKPTFEVDETMLVFAFRYALGRKTGAPSRVISYLERYWGELNDWTQDQICREIETDMRYASGKVLLHHGDLRNYDVWRQVLTWPRKTGSRSNPRPAAKQGTL